MITIDWPRFSHLLDDCAHRTNLKVTYLFYFSNTVHIFLKIFFSFVLIFFSFPFFFFFFFFFFFLYSLLCKIVKVIKHLFLGEFIDLTGKVRKKENSVCRNDKFNHLNFRSEIKKKKKIVIYDSYDSLIKRKLPKSLENDLIGLIRTKLLMS